MRQVVRKKNIAGLVSLLVLLFGCLIAINSFRPVQAADIRNFDPGNIISDRVMRDKDSMNEQQIQNFLNWKNPCNNTKIYLAQQYPKLHYNIRDGKFVCMAQENFDGESAAHIIYRASQDYHINPKVLIVLLEKEQGLITDTWPNHIQYRTATGFGCPDTADCDAQYFGLKNQVRLAANLFDTVLKGGWSNYPVGDNYIRYNPRAECGGSVVNIKNRATSALYRYTPYQPNQSAINAGYGTGDSCGAYGNRNFWLFFNDWFGTTHSWEDMATPSNVDIPANTEFVIRNSQNLVFDVKGSDLQNGASIIAWNYTNNSNQKFTFEKTNRNLYVIRSKINGKVLDLAGSTTNNGNTLQLWDYHGGCNQKWSVVRKTNGKRQLLSACNSNKAIDLNPRDNPGSRPIIYDSNDGIFQELMVEEVSQFIDKSQNIGNISEDRKYTIRTSGGKIFSWDNFGSVFIAPRSASMRQALQIKKTADGFFIITSDNRYLTLQNGIVANGTAVRFEYRNNDRCNQKWRIYKKPGDKIAIVSACDLDLAIDVNPPGSNHTPVLTYAYHGQAVQEFVLEDAGATEVTDPSSLVGRNITINNARNLVMDVIGSDNNDGAWIGSWVATQGLNQQFRLESSGNGYIIRSVMNNKVLDLSGHNTQNGATLVLWGYHGGCNQRWLIVRKANGMYQIVSACHDGKAIDLNPLDKQGVRPVIYDKNSGTFQEWIFRAV